MSKPTFLAILALTGCVADAPGTPPQAPSLAPEVLASAAGQWVEDPILLEHPLVARYGNYVVHHALVMHDAELVDTITVHAADTGFVLCRRERTYAAASEQPFAPDGQLLDYGLIADTCVDGFTPIVHEGYAMWLAPSQPGVLEVIEDVPVPDADHVGDRPFALWTRVEAALRP